MGILSLIIKILLLVFNAVLLAIGSVFFLIGVALVIKKSEAVRVINTLDSTLSGTNRKVEIEAAAGISILARAASAAFCVLGGSVLVLSFCGCCSACNGKTICLYSFSTMLALFLGLQVGLVVGLKSFWPRITTEVQEKLLELQNKYYIPLPTYMKKRSFKKEKVAVSYLINTMQIKFECCGAKKVGDIAKSKSWKVSKKIWHDQPILRPITCCKLANPKKKRKILKPGFDMSTLRDYLKDPDCPFSATLNKKFVHKKTCAKELMKYISSYSSSIMVVIGGIMAAEVAVMACACFLICADDDDDDDYDDYE